jgi:hypothetical protein
MNTRLMQYNVPLFVAYYRALPIFKS